MYIAIEGVIGVGKTTLARLLKDKLDAHLELEVFEENPFLADFYGDRARYAFQTQIFFLLSRYHQQRKAIREVVEDSGGKLITDYTFAKDALFARINLEGDELDVYYQTHEALAEKIAIPDLIVYLKADTDVLMKRIAKRDRTYERDMDPAYSEALNDSYYEYFEKNEAGAKVLIINSNDLDFVLYEEDLLLIEDRIRQALQIKPYQSELPLGMSD